MSKTLFGNAAISRLNHQQLQKAVNFICKVDADRLDNTEKVILKQLVAPSLLSHLCGATDMKDAVAKDLLNGHDLSVIIVFTEEGRIERIVIGVSYGTLRQDKEYNPPI